MKHKFKKGEMLKVTQTKKFKNETSLILISNIYNGKISGFLCKETLPENKIHSVSEKPKTSLLEENKGIVNNQFKVDFNEKRTINDKCMVEVTYPKNIETLVLLKNYHELQLNELSNDIKESIQG